MARRRGWNGNPPASDDEARQMLLDATRQCIDRNGIGSTSLGDVAEQAGVTRQTVYRYFADTDDLFRSAAVLASGGFHERMRRRVLRETGLSHRVAECVVFAVTEIPRDPYLGALMNTDAAAQLPFVLTLRFVREEIMFLAGDVDLPTEQQADELSELLLRLLLSFLRETGIKRTPRQLRALVRRWVTAVLSVPSDS